MSNGNHSVADDYLGIYKASPLPGLILLPDDLKPEVLKQLYQRVLEGNDEKFDMDVPVGETIQSFSIDYTPARDEEGRIIGVSVTIRDITVEKEWNNNQQALIDNTDDLIWSLTKDLKLIAANKAFTTRMESMLGRTLRPGDDVMHRESFQDGFNYEKGLQGESFKQEICLPARNDIKESWTETSFNPIYNKGAITGLACWSRDITERKNREVEIIRGKQNVKEDERKRIGREIHDELGQQLTAIHLDVAWINKQIPEETPLLKGKLQNIIRLLDESHHSLRRILSELRPVKLEDHGLLDALGWLGDQFTHNTGIPVSFTTAETKVKSAEPVAECMFRVYQEALTNITRYSHADKVYTSLSIVDKGMILTIEDNGIGFDDASPRIQKSFGLLGMKERTLSLGGNYELITSPGNGTKIIIRLPGMTANPNTTDPE